MSFWTNQRKFGKNAQNRLMQSPYITGSPYGFSSEAKQFCTGNTLTVMQTSASGGPGNMAHVEQVGIGNGSTIIQSNN